LEALETYIHSQKALLARTQSDITRLQHLRNDAISRPFHFMESLNQLEGSPLKLSEQCDAQLIMPPNIDWTVYEAHDPRPLQNLTLNAQQKYEQRHKPCPYQRSELSDLQKLVKKARQTIVDPVLAIFESMSEPEDEPQEKLDPEEARRQREREKLRELKKRKIQTWGGLKLPSTHARGVFIRHDVEDESLEVDITLDDRPSGTGTPHSSAMDVDIPATSRAPYSTKSWPSSHIASPKLPWSRQPSKVSENHAKGLPASTKRTVKASASTDHQSSVPAASKPRGADKPKPETYKQAWSVSEQHLLEQLLDQIPEGEKNRFVTSILWLGENTHIRRSSGGRRYLEQ
ncbi:hypothetical protein DXG03_005380, partial [Asterophora parasitica]